jgi:hypothetical protein
MKVLRIIILKPKREEARGRWNCIMRSFII